MAVSQLRVVNGKTQAIYDPALVGLLRRAGCELTFGRYSHIDPTPDGSGFMIVWRDQAIVDRLLPEDLAFHAITHGERFVDGSRIWYRVTLAEDGRGFPTKEAAEEREVWLLRHRLFMEK